MAVGKHGRSIVQQRLRRAGLKVRSQLGRSNGAELGANIALFESLLLYKSTQCYWYIHEPVTYNSKLVGWSRIRLASVCGVATWLPGDGLFGFGN